MASLYPNLKIGGAISPPFGVTLTPQELQHHIDMINQSSSHVVYVALGCPKQEKWMANNYNKINAVLLGIGGALPVLAGVQTRAPKWMQDMSLEWLFRLLQEPRRMFRRYLYTNSYFIWLLTKAWLKKG
nr:WecB/TagA/CpsF family glycosyltransferase [Paraflavitalea speifideiaquila]